MNFAKVEVLLMCVPKNRMVDTLLTCHTIAIVTREERNTYNSPYVATMQTSSSPDAHDDAAATKSVFAALKPVCVGVISLLSKASTANGVHVEASAPRAPHARAATPALAPLETLLQLLPSLEPRGLLRCIDYVYLPLELLLNLPYSLSLNGVTTNVIVDDRRDELAWLCIGALAHAAGLDAFCSDPVRVRSVMLCATRVLECRFSPHVSSPPIDIAARAAHPAAPSDELVSAALGTLNTVIEFHGGVSLRDGATTNSNASSIASDDSAPSGITANSAAQLLFDSRRGATAVPHTPDETTLPLSRIEFAGQLVSCLLNAMGMPLLHASPRSRTGDAAAAVSSSVTPDGGTTLRVSRSVRFAALRTLCSVMGVLASETASSAAVADGANNSGSSHLVAFLPGISLALCSWLTQTMLPMTGTSSSPHATAAADAAVSRTHAASNAYSAYASSIGGATHTTTAHSSNSSSVSNPSRSGLRFAACVIIALAELLHLTLSTTSTSRLKHAAASLSPRIIEPADTTAPTSSHTDSSSHGVVQQHHHRAAELLSPLLSRVVSTWLKRAIEEAPAADTTAAAATTAVAVKSGSAGSHIHRALTALCTVVVHDVSSSRNGGNLDTASGDNLGVANLPISGGLHSAGGSHFGDRDDMPMKAIGSDWRGLRDACLDALMLLWPPTYSSVNGRRSNNSSDSAVTTSSGPPSTHSRGEADSSSGVNQCSGSPAEQSAAATTTGRSHRHCQQHTPTTASIDFVTEALVAAPALLLAEAADCRSADFSDSAPALGVEVSGVITTHTAPARRTMGCAVSEHRDSRLAGLCHPRLEALLLALPGVMGGGGWRSSFSHTTASSSSESSLNSHVYVPPTGLSPATYVRLVTGWAAAVRVAATSADRIRADIAAEASYSVHQYTSRGSESAPAARGISPAAASAADTAHFRLHASSSLSSASVVTLFSAATAYLKSTTGTSTDSSTSTQQQQQQQHPPHPHRGQSSARQSEGQVRPRRGQSSALPSVPGSCVRIRSMTMCWEAVRLRVMLA